MDDVTEKKNDDMIERVARAIYEALGGAHNWDEIGSRTKADYRTMAVAGIGAMREPTPKMVAATLPNTGRHCDPVTVRLAEQAIFLLEKGDFNVHSRIHNQGAGCAQDVIGDWRMMIDASLTHEKQKS